MTAALCILLALWHLLGAVVALCDDDTSEGVRALGGATSLLTAYLLIAVGVL